MGLKDKLDDATLCGREYSMCSERLDSLNHGRELTAEEEEKVDSIKNYINELNTAYHNYTSRERKAFERGRNTKL